MELQKRPVKSASEVAAKQYGTREEVETAINSLTDEDHAKLMLIATSFCRGRKLSSGVLEPNELLSEAVLTTLRLDKRWNKRVSIVKHLDRAMENISGHLANERSRIDPFEETLPTDCFKANLESLRALPDNSLASAEDVQELLGVVFGDDEQAAKILSMRAEGYDVAEVMVKLCLSANDYETITRRMRRKIAKYLDDAKQQ